MLSEQETFFNPKALALSHMVMRCSSLYLSLWYGIRMTKSSYKRDDQCFADKELSKRQRR